MGSKANSLASYLWNGFLAKQQTNEVKTAHRSILYSRFVLEAGTSDVGMAVSGVCGVQFSLCPYPLPEEGTYITDCALRWADLGEVHGRICVWYQSMHTKIGLHDRATQSIELARNVTSTVEYTGKHAEPASHCMQPCIGSTPCSDMSDCRREREAQPGEATNDQQGPKDCLASKSVESNIKMEICRRSLSATYTFPREAKKSSW